MFRLCEKNYSREKNYPTLKFMFQAAAAITDVSYASSPVTPPPENSLLLYVRR